MNTEGGSIPSGETAPNVDRSTALRLSLRESWPLIALIGILVVAAVLRFSGINWDENTHLHPDERFLTMVETGLRLPSSLGEYFDPARSPLNPHNAGFTFFVYGTFPIFLVRLLAEWTSQIGYDQVHILGRGVAALFDLIALAFLYALGSRLYGRVVGLLAALLGAFTALLIQHAHFFVVDPFANTLVVAGLFLAVRIQDEGRTWDYALFGLCVGAGAASKISALPLAGVVVLAVAARTLISARQEREHTAFVGLRGMVLAGAAAFVTFRILQPYAFEGPAIWNILPNQAWLSDLEEVRVQSSGLADLPFALQWANRPPILFAFQNMVLWGMGLPLGIVAWMSWGGALVESLLGRWTRHVIPLVWTGAYFAWQASAFTPAMRYMLPVYPTLILFAAWGVVSVWKAVRGLKSPWRAWATGGISALFGILFLAHVAYGVGFAQIYTRPVTRVAASRWIFSHVPAAVNLIVEKDGERSQAPLNASGAFVLGRSPSYEATFLPAAEGSVTAVEFPRVSRLGESDALAAASLEIFEADPGGAKLGQAHQVMAGPSADPARIPIDPPIPLTPGSTYQLRLSLEGVTAVSFEGDMAVVLSTPDGERLQTLDLTQDETGIANGRPFLAMVPPSEGQAQGVTLGYPRLLDPQGGPARITAWLVDDPTSETPLAAATALWSGGSGDVGGPVLSFDEPVHLDPAKSYWLRIDLDSGSPIAVRGSRLISESSWDDGLPLRLDGKDAFGGLYRGLNQELYWSDEEDTDADGTADKLERLAGSLADGDFLVITSNRQYGSIPRVPIRYPMTTAYYRALFDCPEPTLVHVCASLAEPSETVNELGYRLVATFTSHPAAGPLEVNDQTAEEAFTVYDHPKVLVFARTSEFSRDKVETLLGQVDLSHIEHLIPADVGSTPNDLLLPPERLADQQANGTWADLFPRASLLNRSQVLATIVWWVVIALLGWLAFPIVRVVLPGFGVGGYALARTLGLLLLSWGVWFLGSYRVPFQTTTILGVLLILAITAGLLAYLRRDDLRSFLKEHRREIVWIELLALGLFLFDLAIRIGNPDLWHPAKGGEKPMDFSYFNAVLRSTSFPPFDPWFAGGYINYYYYGFVLVGVPVKLLGINPAVAYNLILPTLFSLLGIGGYGIAFELVRRAKTLDPRVSPRAAGLAAAAFLVLLGNLGTVRMGYEGLKQIGAQPGEPTREMIAGIPQALRGLAKFVSLESPLPYRMDEWYWNPSRSIPARPGDVDPITEFPFFTFLYADLHAHMISLPLTVLGLGWAISWILAADEKRRLSMGGGIAGVAIGGLILGSLRPTNTWDFPVYLALGALATAVAPFLRQRRVTGAAIREAVLATGGLLAFAIALYLPYSQWYVQGYTAADLWQGSRTTIRAYFTVHGVFLFFVGVWMVAETIRWMAETPLSDLRKLQAHVPWIAVAVIGTASLAVYGFVSEVRIALIVVPWILWSGILLLRPHLLMAKRVVHVIILAGLALTLLVEIVVLRGDIGRMNTVFKFYLQVWTLFSIAAAAAFAWTLAEVPFWKTGWRAAWTVAASALVVGALLYPLTAAPAKIRDRMALGSPHTLDGTAFMEPAKYYDQGGEIALADDLRAIEWLQDTVKGSPVIVEANVPEYRWGSRATIYTGLPGVLGWNWHQRQQRTSAIGDPVTTRALELADFYTTPSVEFAADFLERYAVRYVLVGGLERLYFESLQPCWPSGDGQTVECDLAGKPMGMGAPLVPPSACTPIAPDDLTRLSCPTFGLAKFDTMVERGLLREAYRDGPTVIYEVLR